jgi:siderophore synthetase component
MNSVEAGSDAWFASLATADPALAEATRQRLPEARRRALARTVLALGREGLLPAVPEAGDFTCALADGSGTLLGKGFRGSPILLRSNLDSLTVDWRGGPPECIKHPARLLELVAASLAGSGDHDPNAWQRLATEISDSVLNEALAQAAHERTNDRVKQRLASRAGAGPREGLRDVLRDLGPAPDGALFLDQWAATGHPLHTVPKTRLGLAPAKALKLLPEFHPVVPVRLAAVRRDLASMELANGMTDLAHWFSTEYPAWLDDWRSRLRDDGRAPEDYQPFPIHPWQAEQVLPPMLGDALDRGDVALLDGPEMPMLPCLSVRSLVPAAVPGGAGFKLAFGVRLTSGVRTITPRSCHMGPRVGRLLNRIFRQDAGFEGRAAGLEEILGAHFRSPDGPPEVEKHLSYLVRENVSRHLAPGEIAAPVAALGEPFPDDGLPLLLELMAPAKSGQGDGFGRFETYVEAYLGVILRTYLVYGIALEAHGQNVLACFDERGRLTKFLLRDFAGIRIHEPTLHRLGIELEVHPDRRTVVQNFEDHRFWLRHRAYHCHLGQLIHGLAYASGESERRYWRCAGDVTSRLFDRMRGEGDPVHWAQEKQVLLEDDWEAKASLRMRLANQVRDLSFSAPNPLRFSDVLS